ncbi:unnamed protein product [Rotaria sp. Silwood2]|nr:unnamed protein product [Rotaria sp. Silwood2]CAF3114618.1 unnamed protein product [Rotaria sp. Silwood2]CAF3391545.1 unnamed protein product [Rotaria sp. Silwood2]CAF3417322.1 unnamed protein product [Rotaria sp. Silwood2]CAF4024046.1 unnamed protein product [Rotaria sp. Silwood2]
MTTAKLPLTSSIQFILSTTIANQPAMYTNYFPQEPIQYETYSLQLGNKFYFNVDHVCRRTGYVSSVSFRLFTNWEGTASLYVFIISGFLTGYAIKHRYGIKPQKYTTQWQTFEIPSRILPIELGQFLAIGMQDSSNTNKIYVVKSITAITGVNIKENITQPYVEAAYITGVASGYSIV